MLAARDYFVVYGSEEELRALKPDYAALMKIDRFAVIATAPGREARFCVAILRAGQRRSRRSGHRLGALHLIPYWSKRLGKKKLHAYQVSPRGGELWCEDRGERVTISGKAVRFFEGTIFLVIRRGLSGELLAFSRFSFFRISVT